MVSTITKEDLSKLQGLFEAKRECEETHKLTMQGYKESLDEMASAIGVKKKVMTKAYSDFKLRVSDPDTMSDRDSIIEFLGK